MLESYRHNSRGMIDVLRSPGVRADLEARARRVLAAAQPNTSARLIADSYRGRIRAGATVIGVPMREEASRRVLGSAIDAAR